MYFALGSKCDSFLEHCHSSCRVVLMVEVVETELYPDLSIFRVQSGMRSCMGRAWSNRPELMRAGRLFGEPAEVLGPQPLGYETGGGQKHDRHPEQTRERQTRERVLDALTD